MLLFKKIFSKKLNIILLAVIIILLGIGVFAFQKITASKTLDTVTLEEVDLSFDPEGPFALLFPRRDGNALVLNLKRTASYDKITYELAYNAEGIDRGVMGEINTKEKKGEYEQEILFGTCSKNVCKYDQGVENGTLVLHITKGKNAYRMTTQWHLQKPDEALGKLTSGDNHMVYTIASKSADLALLKFTIVNDLTGAPKLPNEKVVVGKVYAVNSPEAKSVPGGKVLIELAENPPAGSKIASFDELKNQWLEADTKIDGSNLTAMVEKGGVLTILAPK